MSERYPYPWHWAVNRAMPTLGFDKARFMYDAIHASHELPRLALLFGMERQGKLPDAHQQCSLSAPQEVKANRLTCCLGVRCAECPFLLALDSMATDKATPEEIDRAKAYTCVTHIAASGGDPAGEGYVLDVSDRMFWDNVHASLATADDGDAP